MPFTPNQKFEFELSRSSQSGSAMFTLTVADRASGLKVMETQFDAEQFANLLSTRISKGVPTWFLPESLHQRVGKVRTVVWRRIEHTPGLDSEVVQRWGNDVTRWAVPAEKVTTRRRGGGDYEVFLERHFDTEEQADSWRESAQQAFDLVPTPAEIKQRNIDLATWASKES